jgi:hypothetical protein
MLRVLVHIAAALSLAASGVAAAEPPPAGDPRAVALSDEGVGYFRQQRYDEAISAFAASYAIVPLPLLSFDIAQSYRLKGDCAHAIEFYRRYLREAPEAANRGFVEKQLSAIEPCPTLAPAPTTQPPTATAPTKMTTTTSPPLTSPSPPPLTRRPWLWMSIGGATLLVAAGIAIGVVYGMPARNPTATVAVPGN